MFPADDLFSRYAQNYEGRKEVEMTLFEYLEDNYTLEEVLECFPSVTSEMAHRVLERSESALVDPATA